jgi:hypothetical protein
MPVFGWGIPEGTTVKKKGLSLVFATIVNPWGATDGNA